MILSCFYHFSPNLLRMMMLQLLWEIGSVKNSRFSSVQKHPKPWKSRGVSAQGQANCRNNCLLLSRGRQSTEGILGEHLLHLFQKSAGLFLSEWDLSGSGSVSSYKMLRQVHTSATVCIPTTHRKPPKVLKSVTTGAATNQLWPQFRKNSQLKADIATGWRI